MLLGWDDYRPPIDGPAVAWRAPGHRFGAPRALAHASLAPNGLAPIPAFDAAGGAYVSGRCNGFVFTAPPHRHRFGPPILVAPGLPNPGRGSPWTPRAALDFNLSLSARGEGLASWERGECSFDAAAGNTPGPTFASVLHDGKFGKPLALANNEYLSTGPEAVAVPGGGGIVSWGLCRAFRSAMESRP